MSTTSSMVQQLVSISFNLSLVDDGLWVQASRAAKVSITSLMAQPLASDTFHLSRADDDF